MFGTYSSLASTKIIKAISAGSLKLQTSRKMKKHVSRKFIYQVINMINKHQKFKDKSNLILTVIAKKRFRRFIKNAILRNLRGRTKNLKKSNRVLYIIRPKKCFNGCRAPKKRRKKRIKFRTFK